MSAAARTMSAPARSPRGRRARPILTTLVVAAVTAAGAAAVVAGSPDAGAAAGAGAGYWHTSGNRILDENGTQVRIAGINWYGFETTAKVAHGLYAQDYHDIVDTIKRLGYNTIRLPFSDDVVQHPIQSTHIGWANGTKATNLDLKGLDSLQVMDKIIQYAGQVGLKVILDNHRSDPGNSAQENGLWYTAEYPHEAWLNDWAAIARRYAGNPTVVGFDLRNEPHTPADTPYAQGATWGSGDPATDWRLAAEAAGNLLLSIEPRALILVEGIGQTPNASGGMDATWWGGDLALAGQYPVRLSVAGRLVYSPHDYGPRLYRQSWFNANTTQASLEAVWDAFWGYLDRQGTAPVMVGEFGTTNSSDEISSTTPGSQGQWFNAMITYLKGHPTLGWTYWALNGNDDFGLIDAQFNPTPLSALKQQLLASLQFPLPGAVNAPPSSSGPSSGPSSSSSSSGSSSSRSSSSRSSSSSVSSSSVSSSRSSVSSSRSSSASSGPPTGCRVVYVKQEWPGGFVANVTVTNTGTAPVNGWTLRFSFPGDQRITSSWNAVVTTSGAAVTVANAAYNAAVPAGGSVSFGFQGTWTTSDASPTAYTLNGAACTT